ncbi:hypothetical protein DFJ58DRAFT_665734 [Suillus subalutaceus]|uniref:uncharacterized protein n=1 Tax=Suillus subalutaceus TaxID=48586 RepID=UPI001B8611DF|nr:uncharacterized protein DFJ58DRAFT_665734 [Suillus subalutaceus]KAG1842748.1 hypothetical protein DFJ58DRAFT_665734 [Suillus subalutaceus]
MESDDRSSHHSYAEHPEWLCTDTDAFDLFHEYPHSFPIYNPKHSAYFDALCNSSTFQHVDGDTNYEQPWYAGFGQSLKAVHHDYFAPFLNATVFQLMTWFYNLSISKSLQDLNRLVNDVILADDFCQEDLLDFNASREASRLEKAQHDPVSSIFSSDGWHETSVKIRLLCEKEKFSSEDCAPEFEVNGLYYRKPLEVLKSAYQEVAAKTFHTKPYKLFWQPDDDKPPERIITELYTSDAMLQEHEKLNSQPNEPGCNLETVIGAIMHWSDSTHLASFGNASLWLIYLFIGNQSKYIHGKPTSFAAHHLAYIPKVCPYYLNSRHELIMCIAIRYHPRLLQEDFWS